MTLKIWKPYLNNTPWDGTDKIVSGRFVSPTTSKSREANGESFCPKNWLRKTFQQWTRNNSPGPKPETSLRDYKPSFFCTPPVTYFSGTFQGQGQGQGFFRVYMQNNPAAFANAKVKNCPWATTDSPLNGPLSSSQRASSLWGKYGLLKEISEKIIKCPVCIFT